MFLELIRFLRINQWYKNLIIFFAVVFSGNLLDMNLLTASVAGFFVLCIVSSANYIINDVVDRRKDMFHPEKSKRPVASGKIKVFAALVVAGVLVFLSLLFSAGLSSMFFWAVVFLFGFTTLYSLVLKKIIILDMAAVGINFVVRAIAGALLISVWISPYLVVVPFFFSLFLSAGKKYSDLVFSGQVAYNKQMLRILVWVFFALLIISFVVYSAVVHPMFLVTLPFVVYALLRYNVLVFSGSRIARRTELIFTDLRLLISLVVFGLIVLVVLY